jgi:hypothetical protein
MVLFARKFYIYLFITVKFYGALALSYVIVGFAWLALSIKYWRQLLPIQVCT